MRALVIIPCSGQNDSTKYLLKTLEHLYYPIPEIQHNIIVVDDNKEPTINIEEITKKYPSSTIKYSGGNLGSAGCRDFGVQNSGVNLESNDIIVYLDAHMNPNLYQDRYPGNFLDKIAKHLAGNPNRLLCATCVDLDPKTWYAYVRKDEKAEFLYGTELEIVGPDTLLEPRWISAKSSNQLKYFKSFAGDPDVYRIPVIHGACYAMTYGTYIDLEGFAGLDGWGSEEVYLSLKGYIADPKKYQSGVMKDVIAGHVFKPTGDHPERTDSMIFNKIRIVKELFPTHLINSYTQLLLNREHKSIAARERLQAEEASLDGRRSHWITKLPHGRIEKWLKAFEKDFESDTLKKKKSATPFTKKFSNVMHKPKECHSFYQKEKQFTKVKTALKLDHAYNTTITP